MRLKIVISDGDGLRMGLDWRGAGALKPCFLHSNVVSKRSDIPDRAQDMVDICCDDPDRMRNIQAGFLEETMDLILAARDSFEAGRITRGRYEMVTKSAGFWPNREGLLADRELRRAVSLSEVFRYDWVHSCLQDGALTVELYLYVSPGTLRMQ